MKYGKWVVIGEAGRDKSGNGQLLCRCECGVEREVQRTTLIAGKSRSCQACSNRARSTVIDPGTIYGKWTVVGEVGKTRDGHRFLLCRCECGIELEVEKLNLTSGRSKSCKSCAVLKHNVQLFGRTFTTRQLADLTDLTTVGIRLAKRSGRLTEAYVLKAIGKKVKRQIDG